MQPDRFTLRIVDKKRDNEVACWTCYGYAPPIPAPEEEVSVDVGAAVGTFTVASRSFYYARDAETGLGNPEVTLYVE